MLYRTTNPASTAPRAMSATYLGSHTIAPAQCCVSSSPTFLSIQYLPASESPRSRRIEPWFSKQMSAERDFVAACLCRIVVPPKLETPQMCDVGLPARWVCAPYTGSPYRSQFLRLAP